MRRLAAAVLGATLGACGAAAPAPPAATPASAPAATPASADPTATATAEATASATADATESPGPSALPFFEDAWDRALADAKAHKRLLFVDAWAPWCHTCQSLRAYVFPDPALAPLRDRFTWLAMDTERPSGEAFLAKLPMRAWPTLFVVDPATEQAVLAWPGSLTATELAGLLDDVARGAEAGEAGEALVRGERAVAEHRQDDAIGAFEAALASAPAGWPRRARAVDALVTQLAQAERDDACLATALRELPAMSAGTSRANVAATALGCTGGAKPGARTRAQAAWLRDELSRMVADFSSPILADDRSSLWEQLVDSYLARKDLRNARAAAAAWARFLEAEAARAPDARARAVFDSHRLLAYLALGEPARALPMLEQSEREFPDDYNAPARLARALLELGRTDEALAAIDRAKARVYGPRALRVLSQRADVMAARGDRAGELATLREAVQLGRASALAGGYAKLLAALEARLAKLER